MARTITKSGSKVLDTCPICGKVLTKAGLIGHMAWKHGKDNKAPSLPSKVMPRAEEKLKAKLFDDLLARDMAVGKVVDGLESDAANGVTGEALRARVSDVLASLADSIGTDVNEAGRLVYDAKLHKDWLAAHPENLKAIDAIVDDLVKRTRLTKKS